MPANDYNPDIANRDLKYYIFDWDDNILHMPTYIHLERRLANGTWVPHLVSTAVFSVVRKDTVNYRPPGGNMEKAFVEFRDIEGSESKFLKDANDAIDRVLSGKNRHPPSFNTFCKTLREGRIFAIVTTRGHNPSTLRKGVELFIERILTPEDKKEMIRNLRGYTVYYDEPGLNERLSDAEILERYLGQNHYHAASNPDFIRKVAENANFDPQNSEHRKQFAILAFLEDIFKMVERLGTRKPISVGFSDDDPGNVAAVADFIRTTLRKRFPAVKFVVYDTSDPEIEKGHKLVVSGQLGLF